MKSIPLLLIVLLTSCATYHLQPLAQPGSEVRQARGQTWSVVEKDGLVVEASATLAYEIRFDLKITNKSDKALTFDSAKFRLYSGSPGDWEEISVLSGAEYYRKAEEEARNRPVVTITSTEAPVYHQRTTSTTFEDGSGNSMTIIRTTPQPVIQPETTRIVTFQPGISQKRLDWLKDNLFFSVILEPGKDHSGMVFADPAKGTQYKLVIPVEGKDYEMFFERIKEKGPFTNLN